MTEAKCVKCGTDTKPKAIYSFNMWVSDGTDNVIIRVFGKPGEYLLGVTADYLRILEEGKLKDPNYAFELAKAKVY